MNKKSWTKEEVLKLLNKNESDIPKEIEIDDDNEQICFTLKLPFTINFNKGDWKVFFKTEKEVWKKFEKDETFFGITGIFESELNTFIEKLGAQVRLNKEAFCLEKEARMYEYDKKRRVHIIKDGVQMNIGIRCKTAHIATNIICNLIALYNMKI